MAEKDNGSLLTAILAVQGEVGTLFKDKVATVPTKSGGQYQYRYIALDAIVEQVGPILNKHGLVWMTFPGMGGPNALPVLELKAAIPPDLLLRALRKYDLEADVVVLSFDETWLYPIRRASRDVVIGLLAETWRGDLPQRAKQLTAEVLCLSTDILGTAEVAMAEAQGLEVWCYTANDAGMVAACAAMGVTGIMTDRPDLIRTR